MSATDKPRNLDEWLARWGRAYDELRLYDDIGHDRVRCNRYDGTVVKGHPSCGWCDEHSDPRYLCAHTHVPQHEIECLKCGLVSSHPKDVDHRYCSRCSMWHDDKLPAVTFKIIARRR